MEAPSRLLVSHPSPDGSVVICAVASSSSVRAEFVDEDGWRDVTALVPDLLLIGLAEAAVGSGAAPQKDLVQVGRVFVSGEDPELLFASPAGQVVRQVAFSEARPFIESAIAAQITAGVASEARAAADGVAASGSPRESFAVGPEGGGAGGGAGGGEGGGADGSAGFLEDGGGGEPGAGVKRAGAEGAS